MEIRDRGGRAVGLFGSAEFEPWTAAPERLMLAHSAGAGPVLLLPTASAPDGPAVFEGWGNAGLAHYTALGVPAEVLPVKTRDDAFDERFVREMDHASMIFLSGGKPAYLAMTLGDSPLWNAIQNAVRRGVAFAGCSAGACIAGELAPESVTERADRVRWVPGMALLEDMLVVPHWDALDGYEPAMPELLIDGQARGRWLLSIDERTAAVCIGDEWTVFGDGEVRVRRGERVRSFRPGERFDLLRALDTPGALFHRTDRAQEILTDGFRDTVEQRPGGIARGVWFSDRPLDASDDILGIGLLAVDIPMEIAERYEWQDGGDRYREFCIPADVVNSFGPPRLLDLSPRHAEIQGEEAS